MRSIINKQTKSCVCIHPIQILQCIFHREWQFLKTLFWDCNFMHQWPLMDFIISTFVLGCSFLSCIFHTRALPGHTDETTYYVAESNLCAAGKMGGGRLMNFQLSLLVIGEMTRLSGGSVSAT